ncbi:hypothetical protein GF369_03500 [Candidatus Peregrinibacteria bacterium]|nr:hypothetical protein [Candidatus Peregrinibacteria bacterium]
MAIPAPAQTRAVPAVAVKRLTPGVLKDGGGSASQCQEELPDGKWRMVMTGEEDKPCNLNFNNGVFIRLWEGEIVTTESEGNFMRGIVRVYTSGLPYRLIGDERHLIEPNATADIVVKDNFTHILSKEGRTSVIACELSEDEACMRRGFALLEGDMITLQRDGQLYAWEDAEGHDLTMKSGGCSVSKGRPPCLWVILALWTLMWLRRRSVKRDS